MNNMNNMDKNKLNMNKMSNMNKYKINMNKMNNMNNKNITNNIRNPNNLNHRTNDGIKEINLNSIKINNYIKEFKNKNANLKNLNIKTGTKININKKDKCYKKNKSLDSKVLQRKLSTDNMNQKYISF